MNDLKGQAEEVRRHLHSLEDKIKQMVEKMASENMSFLGKDLASPRFAFSYRRYRKYLVNLFC